MSLASRSTQQAINYDPAAKNGVAARRGLKDVTNTHGASRQAGGLAKPRAAASIKLSTDEPIQSSIPALAPTRSDTASVRSSSSLSSYSRREADDIDARDESNPLMVTEYVQDMYAHMRQKEREMRIDPDYMRQQPHINEKMRAILVDWLNEVHQKFRCVPETLYLTVNLIDRFLEIEPVERSQLQLVGVTALLLAAKYEEIYPPELRDLVYITDKAYTKEEIVSMECRMLTALKYNVTIASTHSFLVRYLKAAHADRRMVWLACYITERVLQEFSMLQFSPSLIASSAVYLARKNLQRNPWSPTLLKYTAYTESDLRSCLAEISRALSTRSSLTAVKKKYGSSKFGSVAHMTIEGI